MVTRMTLGVLKDTIKRLEEKVEDAKQELQDAHDRLWTIQKHCAHDDVKLSDIQLAGANVRHVRCLECDFISVYWPNTEGYSDPIKHLRESDIP